LEGNSACLYKTLVVGVILLFIGVGIQPAYALTDDEKNIKIDNNSRDNEGYGLILCNVWIELYNPAYPEWFPFPTFIVQSTGTIITCKDLDTGKTRIRIAKLGLKLFKFLPIGHDYMLGFGILFGRERYIYNFDGFERIDVVL
jgi:hypothetical protein